jgi:YHS domain-containing protein
MEQPPEPIIESACGGRLTEPEKYPSVEYQGRRIYFCTHACLRVFEQNPEGFLNGEVEHPLDDE